MADADHSRGFYRWFVMGAGQTLDRYYEIAENFADITDGVYFTGCEFGVDDRLIAKKNGSRR